MENPTVNYAKLIEETNSRHYNVADEYKDNVVETNVQICKNDRLPFSVGVINITGELNVGMMIRSACLLGAEKFYIFGRKKFDKRSTVGAEKYIDIAQYTYDAPIDADEEMVRDIKTLQKNHSLIMCETGGVELGNPNLWCGPASKRMSRDQYRLFPPLFLFGSESHGIPQKVLDIPNRFLLSVPQRGVLRSFNVSAAMNIIVWDYLKEVWL